jgi:NitT/TauT family transport system substrate-binding protein
VTDPNLKFATISRRRLIKKTALAAGALAMPLARYRAFAAGPLKPVTVTLDWVYQGPNAGFILAVEKGFYRDAGLDVAVTAGKGSGSTAQLVASKATQFGFADGYVAANGIARGMPLKSVASVYRRNPTAMIVLANSGINNPKDVEGKAVAIAAGSTQFQEWPAFVKGAGIDGSKVQLVNSDPAGVIVALINGRVPAVAGYAMGHVPEIEIRGNKQVRLFWFADYNVTVISNGIIAHRDLLKSDPDLVRAFVTATIKGFLYQRQHPDETVAVARKYLPTIDPKITRRELDFAWKTWVTPNTRGKPLGWAAPEDWVDTLKVLEQYGGVKTPIDVGDVFTNDFVPAGAEYVPPQES